MDLIDVPGMYDADIKRPYIQECNWFDVTCFEQSIYFIYWAQMLEYISKDGAMIQWFD